MPLVARAVWDRESRFAPAAALDPPWWWIACGAIALLAFAVVAVLDPGGTDDVAEDADGDGTGAGAHGGEHDTGDAAAFGTGAWDGVSAVIVLVGFYNGVAPFVAHLLLDGDLLLALPLRLGAPWWWMASLAVLAVCFAALVGIDQARDRDRSG